jgi:hypothetical protein
MNGQMRFTEEQVLAAARAGYAQGQAEFDVPADRTALLVIDMQDEFVRPEWSPNWCPERPGLPHALRDSSQPAAAYGFP